MKVRYLDNASTSFPKPQMVADNIYDYICNNGCNIGRGSYQKSYDTMALVLETRELLNSLFHGDDCKNVVFTKNITESLNILIKGLFQKGDHILVSSMEHNSVMRPLKQLSEIGVEFSRIPCSSQGELLLEKMDTLVKSNTKAIIMTHASNVCGTILPLKEVGEFCRNKGLYFIVDSAQTAGFADIDIQAMNIDALAFTGHKGLLGPQGIGGFLLKEHMINKITPLLSGGTGSISHSEEIPSFMPDRFEAGTLNLPGIIGLRAGLLWIQEKGIHTLRQHELELTQAFIDGCKSLIEAQKINLIGLSHCQNRTGVVSIQTIEIDIANVAYMLDEKYHIMARVGLHCSPSAHKTLGTYPTGTLRFSFGWNNTFEDVNTLLHALEEICHGV